MRLESMRTEQRPSRGQRRRQRGGARHLASRAQRLRPVPQRARAAVTLASTAKAEAIVAVTRPGKTPQPSRRCGRAAILAVTPSEAVARRLALS